MGGKKGETKLSGEKAEVIQSCTEKAYFGIRQMLFNNEIAPGQKLSYSDLSKQLGMSVTPVRQALKRLELLGLMRHEPNKGFYTEPVNLQEVDEIYTFRETIELSMLPAAIENLTKKGEKQLKAALDSHLESMRRESLNERLVRSMEFHLIIASLSKLNIHEWVLRYLYDLLYLKYRGNILFYSNAEMAGNEHREIFNAIVSRNLEKAKRILSRHIQNTKKHVLKGLKQSLSEKNIKF